MRIGLVTFHCSYNFGSALQTWALKHQLESMGHVVQVVDYRGRDFDQYKLLHFDSPKALASSLAFCGRNLRRSRAFESFIREQFNCTERYGVSDENRMGELASRFDCVVCGSDQIWNLDCTQGPVAPFFLAFAGPLRRVAYAPSLSHISFRQENFDAKAQERIASWLSRFSAISVREAATVSLFQRLTDIPIQTCIDPTLLLDADDYVSITKGNAIESGSLFVYVLENNPTLITYAGQVAREMDIPIAYASKRTVDFGVPATNYYGIGPSEFLALVQKSAAVLTNSFHATVFSLLFEVPFQTFSTVKSGSRMKELLENLDAARHFTDGLHIETPVASPLSSITPKLATLRADSLAFLNQALGD